MPNVARRPSRPVLTLLPADGDRVCLFDAILDDTHDHGTVIALRVSNKGTVKALVEWDDDPVRGEAGWCDLDAVALRCPTRHANTRGNHPRTDER
jgi:hypothetical protein